MGALLVMVESLQLVLIDGRRSDQNDAWVLGLGGRVLNDCLQVLFVLIYSDVLDVIRDTCIIGTEEYCLSSVR